LSQTVSHEILRRNPLELLYSLNAVVFHMAQRIAIIVLSIAVAGICVWLLLANSMQYFGNDSAEDQRKERDKAIADFDEQAFRVLGPEAVGKIVSIRADNGDPLTSVTEELSRQTKLLIVNDHPGVAVRFAGRIDGPLGEILRRILVPMGLTIRRDSNVIHVYHKK
jgi:hypothetical protein